MYSDIKKYFYLKAYNKNILSTWRNGIRVGLLIQYPLGVQVRVLS